MRDAGLAWLMGLPACGIWRGEAKSPPPRLIAA
jgi:hypothetical protein